MPTCVPSLSSDMDEASFPGAGFDVIHVGQQLPSLELPAITRTTLAVYAGASGDHNPNHIDSDAARTAGHEDVFAHGMLVMAYLGRLLTNWVPQERIRKIDVRFMSVTHVRDCLVCTGEVVEKCDGNMVVVHLQARDQNGDVKVAGKAWISI